MFDRAPEPPRRPPNIVLILTDDQGYGDLGFHGNPHIRTPHLDRFARESVRFHRFYVSPVCSPTRASIMTGRWNYRTGVVDTYLGRSMMHPDEVTLPEILRSAGYRTGIFGKWHLGDNYPMRPMDKGFQESLVCKGGGLTQPSDPEGNSYFDPLLYRNGRAVKTRGYCTDVFTDAAIGFIERNRRQPFFVYLTPVTPHVPLQIADRYWRPYADAGLDETTARVYGMVENIDENVGRLLRRLAELGLERDTVVIFLTDNGPQQPRYNAGMRGLKGTVYEGGIRVPCFVRWPSRLTPREVEPIGAHVDLLPTLLDMAGAPPPQGVRLDGVSLLPVLQGGPSPAPDRAIFLQWHRGDAPEPWRDCCVVTQRYKLVNGRELYDLLEDPRETTDVAPAHPSVVAQLRRRYEGWFADVSATRGYDPPAIALGSRENPVVLTRQDWRGPAASWDEKGEGHWAVRCVPGTYEITLRLWEGFTPARVGVRIGSAELQRTARQGSRTCTFRVALPSLERTKLEAWMEQNGSRRGVRYVTVRRVGAR